MAVQELATHPLVTQNIFDHSSYRFDLYNINGYIWFPIQSTPRAEPSGRHCHTTYRDNQQQDTVRRDLHQETERHDREIGVNTKQDHRFKHRCIGHRDTEPQGR